MSSEKIIASDAEINAKGPIKFGDHHFEFANFHEGYVRHYIALADTKAAWVFTVASAAIAFIFGKADSRTELLYPQWTMATALVWIATAFLCFSALFSFLVIRPRKPSSANDGIIFFIEVAGKASANAYGCEVAGYNKAEMTAARLQHCYDIARVCASKYASLRFAVWLGLLGIMFTLLQLLWVST